MSYHDPVLLQASVEGLAIKPDGVYVDVTFGGGGHSRAILEKIGPEGRLFAFDQDEDALANALEDERFTLVHANFRHIGRFLKFYGVTEVDGVLADYGVSSHQFNEAGRGFSTRFDADLDMRMSKQEALTAFVVVNEYGQDELRKLFWEYGELRNAPAIARVLVEARSAGEIKTTDRLKEVLGRLLPRGKENKVLAQIYQAIRIEVNQELEVIKEFLMQLPDLMKPGARLSMISYHSLEDRLVKRFVRNGMFEGEPEKDMYGRFEVPFKKVGKLIVPTAAEIAANNRARSAKLRIAERL